MRWAHTTIIRIAQDIILMPLDCTQLRSWSNAPACTRIHVIGAHLHLEQAFGEAS